MTINAQLSNNFSIEIMHTENGTSCLQLGFKDLTTKAECRTAVNYARTFIPNAFFGVSGSWDYTPKGCFISHKGLYWNTHQTGSLQSNIWERSLCLTSKFGTDDLSHKYSELFTFIKYLPKLTYSINRIF